MWNSAEIRNLMRDGRVNRQIYTDPALFELELNNIFRNAWIYLGYESQVKTTGDFFTTRVGRDHVIVTRHSDGRIHAFYNRCTHRGAEVCPEASGNVKRFVCPYHAWTFNTNGELLSVPLPQGYGEQLPSRMRELGLERLARVESYRGFIFASQRAEGVGLAAFLGSDVCAAFDNFVDRAPDGELELAGGKAVQLYRGNWKLHIENSIDFLHPSILHRNAISAADDIMRSKGGGPTPLEVDLVRANGLSLQEWDRVALMALERGHCWSGGFIQDTVDTEHDDLAPAPKKAASPAQDRYRAALVQRHGEARTEEILGFKRHNTLVYPNLFVNSGVQRIRVLHPVAVNHTEQHSYVFRLKGAPDEIFRVAIRVVTQSNTPTSIVTTDDHEALERTHESLSNGRSEWVELSRGLGTDRAQADGRTGSGTSELLIRNQHQAWLGYMTGALS